MIEAKLMFDSTFYDDPRVKVLNEAEKLGDSALLIYMRMLALANNKNKEGVISIREGKPYSRERFAIIFGKSQELINEIFDLLEDVGLVQLNANREHYLPHYHHFSRCVETEKF